MRRLALLAMAVALSACAWRPWPQAAAEAPPVARRPAPPPTAADGTPLAQHEGTDIQKVEFKPGVSSATVERLAKQAGCEGGLGAGLMTAPGPVEVYRMACSDGRVFLARCELRQCRPMAR
ncbi:hypothetical protein [Massilia endophytica]|uniref:hypothetical protein n=1 Tax=Massilia endophytica TaxID=2899220 RepID=UPI001E4DCFB0|nr:hypothetical protein [Massilia endophytica]UGQ45161.1 hypothetical protein LSQ66_15310 [Massilia endophytica]